MQTFCVLLLLLARGCVSQLVVNVKNKGGEILRQSINANTSLDTITLEFQKSDGTLVTHFIDFANEIQIFRALVLGEEERGQTGHQVMCFVMRFIRNEFISSDAMSKLRQKNPGAIRHPEEDKGTEVVQMELMVDIDGSQVLSPYLPQLCSKAKESTYTRDSDLKLISRTVGKDYSLMLGATKRSSVYRLQPCADIQEPWRACLCHYHVCVGWYPCGLKYCKGKDSSGKVVSYRCGIKTCSKCRQFEYYARHKHQCIWDEHDWSLRYTSAGQQQQQQSQQEVLQQQPQDDDVHQGEEPEADRLGAPVADMMADPHGNHLSKDSDDDGGNEPMLHVDRDHRGDDDILK